jgi:hypothetical protein
LIICEKFQLVDVFTLPEPKNKISKNISLYLPALDRTHDFKAVDSDPKRAEKQCRLDILQRLFAVGAINEVGVELEKTVYS